MMWVKKHLLAIIITVAAIAACASVLYLVKNQIEQSQDIARYTKQDSEKIAQKAIRREEEATRNAEQMKTNEKNVKTCMEKIANIQQVDLPDDLLKNAVWKMSTSTDLYGAFIYYSDFLYKNKPVNVEFGLVDMDSVYGIITYDNKQIVITGGLYNIAENNTLNVTSTCQNYSNIFISDKVDRYYNDSFILIDESYDIFPEKIVGDNKNAVASYLWTAMPGKVEISDSDVTVYSKNNVVLKRPQRNGYAYYGILSNGRVAVYRSELLPKELTIIFNDDTKIPLSSFNGGLSEPGCGGLNTIASNSTIDKKNLIEVGKTSSGETIYEYKDTDMVNKYFDNIVYFPDIDSSTKISFDKYASDHPYFVWIDGFGTAIEYYQNKYQSGAECGKPVIYLYPTKDMNVSVKVEPNGGFQLTEPAYNNGWNVWATTKSELTNLSDDASYPYLFWEGKAYNYVTPDKGFVLKRENVGRNMKTLLARLGLNEKESTDFIEFWQPKLEVKPYVYVTFVSQEVFEELAPLTVSPKPDKVIRVFMDYTPLDQFMYVSPLKITTPTRKGFTVVEWGGRLLK